MTILFTLVVTIAICGVVLLVWMFRRTTPG